MMEVMDESDLERELEEADKVNTSTSYCSHFQLLMDKMYIQAPESKIPWNLVGLGLGIGAAVLFVVSPFLCNIHCRLII